MSVPMRSLSAGEQLKAFTEAVYETTSRRSFVYILVISYISHRTYCVHVDPASTSAGITAIATTSGLMLNFIFCCNIYFCLYFLKEKKPKLYC